MSNVTFYLLDETDDRHQQPAHFALACLLATRSYRQKQKCLVYCQDQKQAEQFVEICWQTPSQFNRSILINLADNIPDFHQRFRQVIDFVPAKEQLKPLARERYKQYRAAGCQLDTLAASSINETQNNG
jgi:DNA polymerase-3 subunit chi